MRNIIKIIGLLLLIFNVYALSARTQTEKLIGIRAFDYNTSFTKMEQLKSIYIYDGIAQEQRLIIENNTWREKVYLKKNSDYKQILSGGNESIFTWKLNKDNTTLKITDTKENKYIQKVKLLADLELF